MFKKLIYLNLLFVSIFLTLLLVASSNAKKDESLVLYLTCDEGTGKVLKDLSGNKNEGENHGAKWVTGKYGEALEYSGTSSWITVPDSPLLNFGPKDSFTAECWIKVTGEASGQGNFLAKYAVGAGTTPFYGMFHNANNKVHAYVRDTGGTVVDSWSESEINDDKWHHLALIRDTAKKKVYLYVDGNMDFEGADPTADLTNDVPLAIGRHTGEFLRGIVDEVALWRRPLGVDEVKKTMEGDILKKMLAVASSEKLAAMWGKLKSH